MRKTKRMLAVALAATMVFGSSITAFADTPTSGGTDGTGTSEGHVDQELINVILPTVAAGSTPFAYTMDPERLIQETEAAKYADGTTFPNAETDTGVYFLTAANTYSNTSNTLQAINESSCPITLTVKVKATQGSAKDITLATAADTLTATANNVTSPLLYLGLKVGTATTVVKADEQTITKTIAGASDNFEIAVDDGEYVYQVKESATEWKALNISMTGAVGEASIASDTTAPTVNVTWSYAKAASDATVDTADQVTYSTAPTTYTVTYKSNYEDGPSDATEAVAANGNPTGPETAFTRDGYTLAGWATTADGEAAALSTYTITEAKTLYAIWTQNDAAPSIATTSYTMEQGQSVAVNVDLGVGDLAATGISGITYSVSSGTRTLDTANYTLQNGVLTFASSYIDSVISAGVTSRQYTITFNDDDETSVTITLATE